MVGADQGHKMSSMEEAGKAAQGTVHRGAGLEAQGTLEDARQ